jgi:hypothetical protein
MNVLTNAGLEYLYLQLELFLKIDAYYSSPCMIANAKVAIVLCQIHSP